jgi:ribosome-interacting GTPase 1
MPANLTPQYKAAEERFREARTLEEKRAGLREMLALLPKHKGTDKLQADLRRRLAKLEEEVVHARRAGAHRADPGHVPREGAGQWALTGPPNAGKSALLRALTRARPEVAPYPFTTHAPLSGMMSFEDVQVQLVDTPAVDGTHDEPWMPNLVRNADGVVWVLDVDSVDTAGHVAALLRMLERARVRPVTRPAGADDSALHVARPVLVACTKADLDPDGSFAAAVADAAGRDLPSYAVSAELGTGLEDLRRALWEGLGRVRIYAKEPGKRPDRDRPFVLPAGATVMDLARAVHREIAERLRFARVWGHTRFEGQPVERDHVLADGDVVELHA